jgi:drug/metabolite transporter (DMT)-like permease
MTEHRRHTLELMTGALILSFAPICVKLVHSGPTATAFYRMLFGGLMLLAGAVATRERLWRGPGPALLAVAAGLAFAVDLAVWHRSIRLVGPGLSTLLGNFQVFLVAVYGAVVLRERLQPRHILAIAMGLGGIGLIVGPRWQAVSAGYRWGVVLGLFTAVCYATYLVVLRAAQAHPRATAPLASLSVVSLSSAGFLAAGGWLQAESFAIADGTTWTGLLTYAVLGQVLAWVIIARALPKVAALLAGLILLLQPLLSFLWDVLFFGRPTGPLEWLGLGVSLAGIYLGAASRRGTGASAAPADGAPVRRSP